MKKMKSLLLAPALMAVLVSGCGGGNEGQPHPRQRMIQALRLPPLLHRQQMWNR